MTRWYITTGKSLSTDSRCWKLFDDWWQDTLCEHDHEPLGLLKRDSNLSAFLARVDETRASHLSPPSTDRGQLKTWAAELVKNNFRGECWTEASRRHALPAELATLAVLWRNDKIKNGDTLTLILGTSNELEGRVLEAMLRHLARDNRPLHGVTVETIGPFELDPSESDGFNANFKTMIEALHVVKNTSFVLTGGYKGVLIAITGRLAREHPDVPVYYLHESGNEVIKIVFGAEGATAASIIPDCPNMSTGI